MDIDAEISRIAALSLSAMQQKWRKRCRRDPPKGLPPKLMREAFIYALQQDSFGGLSARTARRLDLLAAKIEGDPSAPLAGDGALRPGARLVREWRGRRFEVEVLDEGFGLNGEVYGSLSEIARHITGARWSGPRFFGLNGARRS